MRRAAAIIRRRSQCLFAVSLLISAIVGCTHDELFGPGGGVTVAVTTPAGVQTGDVRIVFTLKGDEVAETDITVRYSTDGLFFRTASRAVGSVGTSGLVVSAAGTSHTFIWDSARDLDGIRASSVQIRVNPDAGTSETTAGFSVHNSRYLAVSHDTTTARVSLYRLDVNDGDVTYLETVLPGGQAPWDVLFENGYFFVANRDSNDVSVLRLDEENEALEVVEDSPFAGGGAGAKYLATDGDRIFLSNVTGGTISIFDIDDETGKLSLNANSGETAATCRTMVAKSGRLYVASEVAGEILIFDIASSGDLATSGFSPITGGGVASPVALRLLGNRLYAANFATSTVAGFNVLGDGDLSAIAGSPFTFTGSQTLQVASNTAADRIFLATSSAATFASMGIDAIGVATEDASSPHAVAGEAHTVAAKGDVVVVGNSDDESFEAFVVSPTGVVTPGDDNPIDLGDVVGRLAISN